MEEEVQQAMNLLLSKGYEVIPPQSINLIDNEFEKWWNLYNKKRGKDKCYKRWLKLSQKDRRQCLLATPAYVNSITEKQYQKDPFTYLNGRCWEDEIINPYGNSEQTSINLATKAATILSTD